MTGNYIPAWALGRDGREKKCRKCGTDFRDYTRKQIHNLCLPCWKIQNYSTNNALPPVNVVVKKSEKMNPRICELCDGAGCLGCDHGIADLKPEEELTLGEER
jgi:hypothetical protein